MQTSEEITTALREQMELLREEYGIQRIGLFGSFVREEAGPLSDVDLLVEFNQPVGFVSFLRLEKELESLLGRKVDLVTRKSLKKHIGQNILAEIKYVQ